MTPISESALAMGCRCTTTLMADTTAIIAKSRKKNRSIVYSGVKGHQEAGDEQIEQRRGKQTLPGKTHQLVITEAGQRCANPHENEEQEAALGEKPEERHQNRNERREKHQAREAEENHAENRERKSVEGARGVESVIEADRAGNQ